MYENVPLYTLLFKANVVKLLHVLISTKTVSQFQKQQQQIKNIYLFK